jgi:alkylation response protein AidB-like acyl-CoA dehydrogenase
LSRCPGTELGDWPHDALWCDDHLRLIYDIFEGTAEIQQLVIARAISGMHIR